MKTLKINLIASSLLFITMAAFAGKPKPKVIFSSMNYSIAAFIDADTRGNCNALNQLLEDNAKINVVSNGKVYSGDKKQMLEQFKQMQNVQQNCTSKYALLEAGESYALYKVEMQYPTFTRINYVTISNCRDGWKVSNVTSVFAN